MGWRLSLAVVDDAATPVERYLERLVGGPLVPRGSIDLDAALSSSPPLGGLVLGGRTVLFLGRPLRRLILDDEPAFAARVVSAFRGHASLVVDLNSTSNAWGWASWDASGARLRATAGDGDGLDLDDGPPLHTEAHLDAVHRRRPDGLREDAAGAVWSFDQLGESYVFELVHSATGVRLDEAVDLDHEVAVFAHDPDRLRCTLEVEDEPLLVNPDPGQVRTALRCLRAGAPHFAILEASSGSYVQTAVVDPGEVVVEGRLMRADGFVHSSAGRRGPGTGHGRERVGIGGGRVPPGEVLTIDDAARIFEQFLADETLDPSYAWRDRTAELA